MKSVLLISSTSDCLLQKIVPKSVIALNDGSRSEVFFAFTTLILLGFFIVLMGYVLLYSLIINIVSDTDIQYDELCFSVSMYDSPVFNDFKFPIVDHTVIKYFFQVLQPFIICDFALIK